jgi:undecaprenyl-diphosphatase
MDTSLLHDVIQLRRPWLDDVMILAGALGSAGFIWWATAMIAAVYPARRAAAWRVILAVGVAFVLTEYVLKPIVDRPRPFEVFADLPVIDSRPQSASFPSGHAAMAAAGALACARLLPGAALAFWVLAVLDALSRVYVGVHWPTDVVAGWIVGLACAWFVLGGRSPVPRPS